MRMIFATYVKKSNKAGGRIMKYIYTAIFIPNEDDTKYYCRWLVVAEDEENEIPAATPQHELNIPENAVCSIIRIDTIAYRAATDTRAVRKNVSLPAWMANLAEKRGVNCSQVLQEGLMQLLNVSHAQ